MNVRSTSGSLFPLLDIPAVDALARGGLDTTGLAPETAPTALAPALPQESGPARAPVDPATQGEARQRASSDPQSALLRHALLAEASGGACGCDIAFSDAAPTADALMAGLLNAAVESTIGHVLQALSEVGLAAGPTIDDKTTRAALAQLKGEMGFTPNGDLDLEAILALLLKQTEQDRARSAPSSGGAPSSSGGAPSSSGGAPSSSGGAPSSSGGAPSSSGGAPSSSGASASRATGPVDTRNWKPGAGDVTPAQLQRIVPSLTSSKAAEVAPHLNRAMREANISTPERKAAFIAQLAHESGGFKYNQEIASGAAYEGRRDLGNTQPGDGRRYKGRGYIQLTGRANYAAAGKALGLDLVNNPELAAKPENASRVAAWYWNSRGLNKLADEGNFDGITKRINGGYNGKADRDAYHARALRAGLGGGLPSTGAVVEPSSSTSVSSASSTTGAAPASSAAAASAGSVDPNHPHLRALANGRMVPGKTGYCVATTLDNMQRNGVPQPAATGNDVGNNPRGAMVQMVKDYGWKSLPGVGTPTTMKSPYGTVQANVIPAAEYKRLADAGQIPSGAVVFQTRHASWNGTSSGSSGYDMGIARNGGRTIFNYADMGGPMVYGKNTTSVVVLVPGGAVR